MEQLLLQMLRVYKVVLVIKAILGIMVLKDLPVFVEV